MAYQKLRDINLVKYLFKKNNFIATNFTKHSKLLNKEKYNKRVNLKMY